MHTRSRPLTLTVLTFNNRLARVAWNIVYTCLYRPSPRLLHAWRRCLLRCFGARIASTAYPYPKARIWAPWNLIMDEGSCIADDVDCYSVAVVHIGARATVSQYSYLCSASHDYRHLSMPLVSAPIVIGENAWVAADVFVGPGVYIAAGAVVGARSTVLKDVEPWTVVGGSPAKKIADRSMVMASEPVKLRVERL